MLKVSLLSTKISFFLLAITYLPFLVQIPFLLKFWLKVVPPYTVIFCILQLVRNLIEQLYLTLSLTISAEGDIRGYSIFSSIFNLLPLPISYILFKFNHPPYFLYLTFTLYAFFYGAIVVYYVNKICKLSIELYVKEVFVRCVFVFLIAFSVSYYSTKFYSDEFISLLFSSFVSIISLIILIWLFGLRSEDKMIIKGVFLSFSNKGINQDL
jgi:hypothetical protein